jgi:hypothetical protein
VADYSKPGDDGGILPSRARWEVETRSRPLELGCGRWFGLEIRATQDRFRCGGFNYRKLYERARDIGGEITVRTLECPATCGNRRARVVESSWSCKRAWVRLWFLRLPLFRAEVRVLWAVGCENGQKLPALETEDSPGEGDFKAPRDPGDRPGLPGPDHSIEEHHGFRGPPASLQLPCSKLTTFSYTYCSGDSRCPPADFEPAIDMALANARIYAESLWCAPPCWPGPGIGLMRREWGCEDEDTVKIVLYFTLVCEEGVPDPPEEGE